MRWPCIDSEEGYAHIEVLLHPFDDSRSFSKSFAQQNTCRNPDILGGKTGAQNHHKYHLLFRRRGSSRQEHMGILHRTFELNQAEKQGKSHRAIPESFLVYEVIGVMKR